MPKDTVSRQVACDVLCVHAAGNRLFDIIHRDEDKLPPEFGILAEELEGYILSLMSAVGDDCRDSGGMAT